MFHTKICGVRQEADINSVAASGADAIGLNFFPRSVRYVDPQSGQTRHLSEIAGRAGLLRVGVFVNESADEIMRIAGAVSLDAIQLHGDEEPSIVSELATRGELSMIRAIKLPIGPLAIEQISDKADPWIKAGCHLLFDADGGIAHGGSGKTLDWKSIRLWSTKYPEVAWTLAGGLHCENITTAILESGAISVDTASGVEERKGEKSDRLIRRFVQERQNVKN